MSRSTSCASSTDMARPVSDENATTRVRAPSSSRILVDTRLAMKVSTCGSGTWIPSTFTFLRRIAIRVSRSGGWMSVIRPHSKRLRSLSSSVAMSRGGRSEDSTICEPASYSELKVWKNSSWKRSLPSRHWTSSIRKALDHGNDGLRSGAILRRGLTAFHDSELERTLAADDVADGGSDQAQEVALDPVAGELARDDEHERVVIELETPDVTEPLAV